jgi:hypothetical protein
MTIKADKVNVIRARNALDAWRDLNLDEYVDGVTVLRLYINVNSK